MKPSGLMICWGKLVMTVTQLTYDLSTLTSVPFLYLEASWVFYFLAAHFRVMVFISPYSHRSHQLKSSL